MDVAGITQQDGEVLERARAFFDEVVRPQATALDLSPGSLRRALEEAADRELLALKRPREYGGPEVSERAFREFQEMSARASGAFSFLVTQHQGAVSMIARSENEAIKTALLPGMHNGAVRVGVGFSQLRRQGPPLVKAISTRGGYVLNGHVPWITGWTFFDHFVIGATLPGGEALFGVLGFSADDLPDGMSVSEPMRLAAMESAQTVTADLKDVFLPADQVLYTRPAGWAVVNDRFNIVIQGTFALGCARAGLDVVEAAAKKKDLPFLHRAFRELSRELDTCREAAFEAHQLDGEETTEEKLKIRAWAIDLAVRCAHAAITASSGAANGLDHPAQRIYREALVYTVSAQTTDVMRATLDRLIRPQ